MPPQRNCVLPACHACRRDEGRFPPPWCVNDDGRSGKVASKLFYGPLACGDETPQRNGTRGDS